jgi:hypothetical protein
MLHQGFEATHRVPAAQSCKARKGRLCRFVRITLGVLLLLGGIAGLVLPILQGVLMIMAGLTILRKDIPWVARLWERRLVPWWERRGAPWWERRKPWLRYHSRRAGTRTSRQE